MAFAPTQRLTTAGAKEMLAAAIAKAEDIAAASTDVGYPATLIEAE